ncbi:MAG: PAS domain-containing sensor histidine kinase [Candidatus Thorarchaeota archaeon]|jgi:PAS domain S-box-containing protein
MASIDPTNHEFPKTGNALEKILEHSMEGIAIIGDDKRIEYINDRVCEIIGRTRDEVLGESFQQFVHRDSLDIAIKRYASRLGGELIPSTYEARVLHSDDEIRDVRIHTTVLMNGENKIKILAQILDITNEKRTQQALSEHEMMYHTLVKTINEGLGVIDDHGILVQANPALCRMLDYTEEELIGKTTTDIMHGLSGEAVFEKIRDRIAGNSERYETYLIHRSGRLIPVMVSASPLLNDTGEYSGSCIVITDITKQKITERDLHTARDRAMLYLDMMRHDIRNHLQEVQFSVELLLLSIDDSLKRELLENILHAVSKSSAIISNSRTIEQLAELPLRVRLLDDVLSESMKDASILLEDVVICLSLHALNARIKADEYLELLLSDLLVNAYDNNPADMKRIWVDLTDRENNYELVISDNGPGIPDSDKRSLFDPKSRFEGVGFHLTHHIVKKYGGSIEVLDRVNGDPSQGKRIRVVLPRL